MLDLTDPNLTDFTFNGLCPLAGNQPTGVKESLVGGEHVGRGP